MLGWRHRRTALLATAAACGVFFFVLGGFGPPAPAPGAPPRAVPAPGPPSRRAADDDAPPWEAQAEAEPDQSVGAVGGPEGLLPLAEQGLDEGVIEVPGADLKPYIFPNASPERMHGQVGLKPDGIAGWPLMPTPKTTNMAAELRGNGFYVRLSDSISLDRPVQDNRDGLCSGVKYDLKRLPQTSVVMVFHNEAMTPMMRSVHSVLNRSPPELLREIILVDDGSTHSWLKEPLEEYIKLLPKVKLYRLPKRSGLVIARLTGIHKATGETFVVLDSHIEVQPQWLEPLMHRISQGRNHVVMPIIDSIDPETFGFRKGGIGCTLGFLWRMVEHGIQLQAKDAAQRTSPIDYTPSPTHAGGLFAANRQFFWELGGYDREFGWWGAENLEFSFRIWQCGGTLDCAPCSRVYHIFRKGGSAYSLPSGHVTKNKLRTAAIWMDEFGFLVEDALGNPQMDIGPTEHMLALKDKLQCKPYSWFLKNVYPESLVTDLDDLVGYGEVESVASPGTCLDTLNRLRKDTTPGVHPCQKHGSGRASRSQRWLFHRVKGLRPVANLELCIVSSLQFKMCDNPWAHTVQAQMPWRYTPGQQLENAASHTCLTLVGKDGLGMQPCRPGERAQQWHLERDFGRRRGAR